METSTTADHTLRILLHLASAEAQTPADVARALSMNRTVVHRLLATLHARGFVRRVNGDSVYSLGPSVLYLSQAIEPSIRAMAKPVLRELAVKSDETALLFMPDGSVDDPHVTAIDQELGGDHVIRIQFSPGQSFPMHVSSAGRVLLAFLEPTRAAHAIDKAPEPVKLKRSLEAARKTGYAISRDELLPGVSGIAAPILDAHGFALGSLSIAVPTDRAERLEDYREMLVDYAAGVSRSMQALDQEAAVATD